jgi:hypothetical protein
MKPTINIKQRLQRKYSPVMRCKGTLHNLNFIGASRTILAIAFPLLLGMLLRRNDYSLKEDLLRLCIFTIFTAVWWYQFNRKKCMHA